MIRIVDVEEGHRLDSYAEYAHLSVAVQDLRNEARTLVPRLAGRKLWMVNSTERGGGVAEMLPMLVSILREVGVPTDWVVMGTDREPFFQLTKQLHNMIHGAGSPILSAEQRALYDTVSRELADELRPMLGPNDMLVVHDPQPAGMGALLERELDLTSVWRCHIGLDRQNQCTEAAWQFLKSHVCEYQHAVFSAPEYIPDYMTGNVSIIHPAIDPLSFKNRDLSPHASMGVLCNAGLVPEHQPVLTPPYERQVTRLRSDGTFGSAVEPDEIGLVFRTIITQISRWDRLKGWHPLLEGFARLKRRAPKLSLSERQKRRLQIARLVLAGPEPAAVADDPEAKEVLAELIATYRALEPDIQRDVVLLSLPMDSREKNALMVNALQRCSSLVVQNSVQEGFGLTATEAMWKRVAVLGSRACGLRQQIRDQIDGRLTKDPSDPDEVGAMMLEMLNDNEARDAYARSAQRRVHDEFLVFTQVRRWLELLVHETTRARPS